MHLGQTAGKAERIIRVRGVALQCERPNLMGLRQTRVGRLLWFAKRAGFGVQAQPLLLRQTQGCVLQRLCLARG